MEHESNYLREISERNKTTMIESALKNGDVLSKVTKYELNSEDAGRVFIEVHEIIATPGCQKTGHKFVAYPSLVVGHIKQEYIVAGNSADEVLIKCLEKLKEVKHFIEVIESVSPEAKAAEEVKQHILAVLKGSHAKTDFVLTERFLLHQVITKLNPMQKDQLDSALQQLVGEGVLTPELTLTEQGYKHLYS